MSKRMFLADFATSDPVYAGAIVSVWKVVDGVATTELAPLFGGRWSDNQLANPQGLSSSGRWVQPVYVDVPVVLTVSPAANERGSGVLNHI